MLDTLDRKILQTLESDARQSKTKIAAQLRTSKTVVSYRINRLEKNGVIKGYQYISNQAALGLLSFGLLIRFQGLSLQEQQYILARMRLSKKFDWVTATNGKWDAIAVAIKGSTFSFNRLLDEFFAQYGVYIKEYNFYIDYEGSISAHNYLYNEPFSSATAYRHLGANIVLSDTETAVYKKLQINPLLSLLSIAKQLNKTYDTIQLKYRSLVTKGILARPVPIVNCRAVGYEDTLCLYNLAPNTERVSRLLALCVAHPNIVRYSRCLGHINLVINIHSQDGRQLKEIIGTINKQFSDIIIGCDLIQAVEE